jgi:hypothetical protein
VSRRSSSPRAYRFASRKKGDREVRWDLDWASERKENIEEFVHGVRAGKETARERKKR